MIIKNRMPYYLTGVFIIFILALFSPLRLIGDSGESISVIRAVIKLPAAMLYESGLEKAYRCIMTDSMYNLMPVAGSIASASYIYDELKSGAYLGMEFRKGRYRYIYSRFLYSALSGAGTVAAGLLFYTAFAALIFPPGEGAQLSDVMAYIAGDIFFCAVYGMVMSAAASFLLFLYPNLYIVFSIIFVMAYLFGYLVIYHTERFMYNYVFMGAAVGILAILYAVLCKIRSSMDG